MSKWNGLINSDTVSAKPSLKVQFAAIESKFLRTEKAQNKL